MDFSRKDAKSKATQRKTKTPLEIGAAFPSMLFSLKKTPQLETQDG